MGYVAPVHQWEVRWGACIRCPLSISSVTADSRIGLKLFGQFPYDGSVAQFFFSSRRREDRAGESWVWGFKPCG